MRHLFATPSRLFTTILILVLSSGMIVLTVLAWQYSNNILRQRSEEQFNSSIQDIRAVLSSRFNLYVSALYSGKGLYDASDSVSRKEWHDFSQTVELEKRFPGISSLGFHEIVSDKNKSAFEQSVRKDTTFEKNGYPNFKIFPEGKRDEYYVLKYTEPFTASSAAVIGFDYKTNDVRRRAEDAARASGTAVTSGLFFSISTHLPVFIIALPVYKKGVPLETQAQRIAAAEGFVVGGFNIKNLFSQLFPAETAYRGMDFQIYDHEDSTSTGLLFDYTGTKSLDKVAFYKEVDLQVPGKTWSVAFSAQEGYGLDKTVRLIPYFVLLTGTLLSLIIIGVIVYLRTSQERALSAAELSEKKYKESEDKYQLIFESLPDVFYQTDWKGTITEVTKSITQYTGLTREEVIGKKATDFYPVPEERKTLLSQLIRKGKVNDYLVTLKGKNKIIHASLTAQIMFNSWKVPVGVQGILRDVSERLAADEKVKLQKKELEETKATLETQNSLLNTLLNTMPLGVLVVSAKTKEVLLINPTGMELTGQTKQEVDKAKIDLKEPKKLGVTLFKDDGDPYPLEETPLFLAMKSKKVVTKGDIVMVKKSGDKLTIRATAVPIFNDKKEIEMILNVFEDITREHEVDRMKTEFISLASHQLRTPLSAMRWYLEMLLDGDAGKLSAKQTEFMTSVNDSNLRLIHLVNSLLNVSRIESGRIMIEPKPTDVNALLKSILDEVKEDAKKKKQSFIVSLNSKFPPIKTDPGLLRNALMNLLTNAIKYTPEKGEITVLASKKEGELIIQIGDNGYGIPKSEQKNVFKKFYRGSNVVKVVTDGNGLGMYLVKAVIDSLNGTIKFESKEKEGTTFWIRLPFSGIQAKKGEVTLDS